MKKHGQIGAKCWGRESGSSSPTLTPEFLSRSCDSLSPVPPSSQPPALVSPTCPHLSRASLQEDSYKV